MRRLKNRITRNTGPLKTSRINRSTKSGEVIAVETLRADLRKHARVGIQEARDKGNLDVNAALKCLGNWLIATGVVVPGKRLDLMLDIGIEAITNAHQDAMTVAPSETED